MDPKNLKVAAAVDENLKKFCDDNKNDLINNDNLDESCLGQKKLHVSRKGNAYLASNFIKYVKAQPIS